jgi:hypothetical protein
MRFVAGSCVFSAWLTLIVSLVFGIGSVAMGAGALATAKRASASSNYFPTTPNSGGGGGILPGFGDEPGGGSAEGGGGMAFSPMRSMMPMFDMVKSTLPVVCFASGAFSIVTGVVGFILLLGIAQLCYCILDIEEQSYQTAVTLSTLLARMNSGGGR